MYDFRITPDDQGIEQLRRATRERSPAAPVAPPNPSRAVRDQRQTPRQHTTQGAPNQGMPHSAERRGSQDRRRGERRQAQQPVMLDTRTQQDRRRGDRRQDAAVRSAGGVDLFA